MESFYINNSNLNLILLYSIIHYHFVVIHPFTDENGYLGQKQEV